MKGLSLNEAEYIAHRLASELMDYGEPVPPFATRYPGKLESCLAQPFASAGGEEAYPTLAEKAAILFYLVIKNHPFENGNKRMAVTLMLVFLFNNQRWVDINPRRLYDMACQVAESTPGQMKEVLIETVKIFEAKMVNVLSILNEDKN